MAHGYHFLHSFCAQVRLLSCQSLMASVFESWDAWRRAWGYHGSRGHTVVNHCSPVYVDEQYFFIGLPVSTVTGLLSGVGLARRAIRVDPVEALHDE